MKKRILSLVLALAIVLPSAAVPAFAASSGNLKQQRETEHFVFYCEDEDVKALDDLASALEDCYERTTTDLGKAPSDKAKVYIYPDIQTFHNAVGNPDYPDSVVGRAYLGAFHMTSPLNPGPQHSYDSIITVAVHEFVHTIVNLYNNVPIYLHEGVACYEAGQYSGKYQELSAFITNQMQNNKVPSLNTLESANSGTEGLYEYSYAYVDFISRLYGFDKVVELLEGKSRKEALGANSVGNPGNAEAFNQFWWNVLRLLYVDGDGLTECLETDSFVLTFAPQDSEAASKLADRLEKARARITADLGVVPDVKTMIKIYPDTDSLHKAAYHPEWDDSAVVVFPNAYRYNLFFAVSPDNPGTIHNSASVMGSMTRYSAKTVLSLFGETIPSYLFEGISYYYAGANTDYIKEYIKKAADNNTLPTLNELEKMPQNDSYLYAFVDFSMQNVGGKGLASLLEGKSRETVFGMTAQQLEETWQAFLKNYDTPVSAPNLDTADEWAKAEITSAVKKGFVPAELQNNYKNVISREQFCKMAVMYLEYATGKKIDTILSEKKLTIDPNCFADTDNEYILAASALGITNGAGKNEAGADIFAPQNSITREMAATMLTRLCKVLDKDTENAANAGYTDISEASNWAVNSINFCKASGVMNGTSQTPLKFSPKETYTIQQSIATFDRLS